MLAHISGLFRKGSNWFINADDDTVLGPYADKADAQMALLFYSERLRKPSEKQLRALIGRRGSLPRN